MAPDLSGLLEAWVSVGWLRPLDGGFAEFLKSQAPDTPETVLLMSALVSHQLGRGYICLDLEAMLSAPENTLSLPPEDITVEQMPAQSPNILKTISLSHLTHHLEDSALVASGPGNTPLVLCSGLLYLRRYWEYTQNVVRHIQRRLIQESPVPDDLESRLDTLFEPLRVAGEKAGTEIHWQSVAAAIAAKSSFSVISGGPGTGKTTTVVHLLALLQQLSLEKKHKLRIRMAAPTGKAAARLTESLVHTMETLPQNIRETLPRDVSTLHRLLGSRPDTRHFIHNLHNPLHVDLLVVDEASMVDLETMSALLDALPEKARLVLLGDKDQLASVEAGSVLGDICQYGEQRHYQPEAAAWIQKHTGYNLSHFQGNGARLDQHITLLRKNHRFGKKSGIGALSRAVNEGNPQGVEEIWHTGFEDICRLSVSGPDDESFAHLILDGTCHFAVPNPQFKTGYRPYLDRVKSGPGNGGSAWHRPRPLNHKIGCCLPDGWIYNPAQSIVLQTQKPDQ